MPARQHCPRRMSMTIATARAAMLAATLLTPLTMAAAAPPAPKAVDHTAMPMMMSQTLPNATFTLRTGIANGKMVYVGKGGDIDCKVNPTLTAHEGDVVQITLINGEGAEHNMNVPDMRAAS